MVNYMKNPVVETHGMIPIIFPREWKSMRVCEHAIVSTDEPFARCTVCGFYIEAHTDDDMRFVIGAFTSGVVDDLPHGQYVDDDREYRVVP